jgi:hypothetical protein
MSPQDTATASIRPPGNLLFYLCGLSVTQFLDGKWMSVILENTGAPNHSTGHDFQLMAMYIDDIGLPIRLLKVPLVGFNNNDRELEFKAASTTSPGSHNGANAGDFHFSKTTDFSSLISPTPIDRSRQVKITKVRFPPGIGFTATLDSKGTGKCFGIASECTTKTLLYVESKNDNGDSYATELEIPTEGKLVLMLNNDCANPNQETDTNYYYNSPPNYFGIIGSAPIEHTYKGGRVACNARLVSKIDGGISILDAVK